jgi:hypothetical protein
MKRLDGSGWKISYVVIKKFQLQPLKVFTLKSERFHFWISSSVFLNLRTLNTQFNIILQNFTIAMKPASLLYSTAQTHENININRRASDIFSTRRTGFYCDSRQLYESNQTFHSSLLVFPRKYMKPELMHGTPTGSIHTCHFSEWTQSEIFTQWFLHFRRNTKSPNTILLSLKGTGIIHTQGTWRSLL